MIEHCHTKAGLRICIIVIQKKACLALRGLYLVVFKNEVYWYFLLSVIPTEVLDFMVPATSNILSPVIVCQIWLSCVLLPRIAKTDISLETFY